MIHRLGLASWNINIVWPSVQLVGVFDSIPHFSLPVEIVFVLVFFLLYWSLTGTIIPYDLIEILISCYFYWRLNSYDDRPWGKLRCTDHLHAYKRLLNMGMIWCKKLPYICRLKIITSKEKLLIIYIEENSLTLEHYL